MLLLLSASSLAAGAADCPRKFDTAEIIEAANATEKAFTKLDKPGFRTGQADVESRMVCASEILSPAAQARIHRVQTLGAFLDGRMDRVPVALSGLFAAEPGHQIPASLLPDGHPIRGLVPSAMAYLRDDPGVELPKPGSGWIEADGAHSLRAATQRSSLLQQLDGQGAVLATHYRWPDEAGFDWVVPVAGAKPSAVATRNLSESHAVVESKPAGPWAHRAPLLALAGTSLVTSGVLFALAADARAEFDASPVLDSGASADEEADYRAELTTIQGDANGFSYGCYATLGVGVALGVVTVVTW
ncbi:hypothetical protein LBMAG42_25940 [Deltaproteobacteria bacterium]|nr:hypothetical protein LBMAG42_25940 [Deltaproteobacteria bacterium]